MRPWIPALFATLLLVSLTGFAADTTALFRTVDLDLGETQQVELVNGKTVRITLKKLDERRDILRSAVREAKVEVEIDGKPVSLTSAIYTLPTLVESIGVQIDCPITLGYTHNGTRENVWALRKAARFRLWTAGSPWIQPVTFSYPLKQRWFATATQMANEPTYVDGGDIPGTPDVYYHYGLDFGGAEGLVEVVAATDGQVVSAAGTRLPEHAGSPAKARYDVVYVVDSRGWYYRYSHLKTIDVKAGDHVSRGQRLGTLGKEGTSGGWSHLHFDITSRQPSGEWGIQDAYAYVWEAYQNEYSPKIIAVARPHHLAAVNQVVTLSAEKSWSKTGKIASYEWTFSDGTTASTATAQRSYDRPGTYNEILKVTDSEGNTAWDFAAVQVANPKDIKGIPASIHLSFYPSQKVKAGDEVTFKVRTFRTQPTGETIDFGDGTPPITVRSDGAASRNAPDGYAISTHRFQNPGNYLVKATHTSPDGHPATTRVWVEVK